MINDPNTNVIKFTNQKIIVTASPSNIGDYTVYLYNIDNNGLKYA